MSNNVEKFVVSLGFKDSDIRKLKELLKLEKSSKKEALETAKAQAKVEKEILETKKKQNKENKVGSNGIYGPPKKLYENHLKSFKKTQKELIKEAKKTDDVLSKIGQPTRDAHSSLLKIKPKKDEKYLPDVIQGPSKDLYLKHLDKQRKAQSDSIKEAAAAESRILKLGQATNDAYSNIFKNQKKITEQAEKAAKAVKEKPVIHGPSKEMFLANQRAIREKAARDNDTLRQVNAMRSVKLAAMKMGFDESRVEFFTEQAKGAYKSREAMRALTLQMQEAAFKNRDLNKQLAKQNMLMRGLSDSSRNLVRSYVSVFAVLGASTFINQTGQKFESMESSMLAATGSTKEAAKEIEFLDKMTDRLGLSLVDTADAYSKFLFASKDKLSQEQTRELFEGLSELGTTLGISKERMKLSMNSITQMMNKTKVTSEELKNQLAESLPG